MAERIHPKTTPRNEQEPSHPPALAAAGTYVNEQAATRAPAAANPAALPAAASVSAAAPIVAGIFYLIFRPEAPNYSVDDKIGIYYERGSSVEVYYKDVSLCDSVWPQFYQPSNNVTVFKTALKGSSIELTSSMRKDLVAAQTSGKTVP
ncbi:hypothetical protein WN944_007886 [Citrus x changshan-huyou]|uniref:Uncharacterized protein n=1 Tax=Citrus x changshan-huyou TaxID=2935761 RepID=A0AAP0QUT0_9ROSI